MLSYGKLSANPEMVSFLLQHTSVDPSKPHGGVSANISTSSFVQISQNTPLAAAILGNVNVSHIEALLQDPRVDTNEKIYNVCPLFVQTRD